MVIQIFLSFGLIFSAHAEWIGKILDVRSKQIIHGVN